MTKLVYVVYVHPIENGEPKLYKVEFEQWFATKEEAEHWVRLFNYPATDVKAVYYGCVDNETGELVDNT